MPWTATQIYWELGADWSLRRAHTRLRPFGVRPRTRTRRPRGAVGWEALSPAELAVAHLVAEGRSNREIAAELFLARGTVESHVSHILGKLGAHSRIAIARAVMDHPHEVSRKA